MFDASHVGYMLFMYKHYTTCIAKNKFQADFSHKLYKNDFFKIKQ